MKKISILIFWIFVFIPLTGCGRPAITLRVLDEETKKPIEGAVAIAWWTRSEGLPGLSYTRTARVEEKVSDSDGNLTFSPVPPGHHRPIPDIKIYKPGYVGWHNFSIYKGCYDDYREPREIYRTGFEYKSQDIYLEHWKDIYTRSSHYSFLEDLSIDHQFFKTKDSSLYLNEIRKFELPLLDKEEKAHELSLKGEK